ncbi:MAG: hypothetical protein DWQ01_06410 [Planctomycetota bacterium]|nr:MAG: hypothetical protein DWQ01_06410 [Planctomycetota bacterium]
MEEFLEQVGRSLLDQPEVVKVLLLALTTFLSEDLTCVAAGILAGRGDLAWSTALIGCYIGIIVGDGLLWVLGRTLGRKVLQLRLLRGLVTPMKLRIAEEWFNRNGLLVVLISRFLPGSRFPTYICAGMLGTKARGFLTVAILAGAFWTPALVWLSSRFGMFLGRLFGQLEENLLLTLPISILLIVLLLKLIAFLISKRERKLTLARWKRRLRWEFWPVSLFQLPVLMYAAWQAIRWKGLRHPLTTNPAIELSGFVGESKYAILQSLGLERREIPASLLLKADQTIYEKGQLAGRWLKKQGLQFPLIVKPDVAQRGSGLRKVQSQKELEQALAKPGFPILVQEYLDLPIECGLSWEREPGSDQGRVTGITLKEFPAVTGDGRRTLEELVLAHPRQRFWADLFLQRLGAGALEIPEAGQVVSLAQAGNHAQGTTFRDGSHLCTPELDAAVAALLEPLQQDFSLGRLDVRAPSLEALQAGEGLRVIELNGVTGEPTHIYDPDRGLWKAWRTSLRHWRQAFRFGALQRKLGHRPPPYRLFFQKTLQTWKQLRRHPPAD